jgi:hypothetical protein
MYVITAGISVIVHGGTDACFPSLISLNPSLLDASLGIRPDHHSGCSFRSFGSCQNDPFFL